jgi:phosphoglycerate kinase
MINLPKIDDADLEKKRVLVRADLDVNITKSEEVYRLEALLPTLRYLSEKNCIITLIGHRGRPEGKVDEAFSLKPVEAKLREIVPDIDFTMQENLRFDPGEESNDPEYAKKLCEGQDFFVNEAFAASHREHASIVGIPKILPYAAGIRLSQEIENLSKVLESPKRPLVAIISGVKKDKLEMIPALEKICDKVLVGGRLPDYLGADKSIREYKDEDKIIVANLVMDKEDITLHSIDRFKSEIAKAKTIILAGVPGKYEDPGHMQGTKEVFEAVARSDAFRVVGGGDSLVAITLLHLENKFDWISVGGGAMLEFLVKGTLPGIVALEHK